MRNILILATFLILTGCASTKMSTFKDPEFGNRSYRSVIVLSNFSAIEDATYFESAAQEEFTKVGIRAIRGVDVILPTRTYAEGEIGDALANSGAEALIYVKLVDAYSTSSYVPPTYSTSGSATTYGNTTSLNTTTYQYGGYNINKPVEKYEISVTDLNNWQTVMVSSGTTKGNAFANSEDLSDSLASEIVDELIANGLIAPNR